MVERLPDGGPGGSGDSFRDLILSSLQSTGFWSFVAAVVGVVALLAGGAMYFTVEEIREFSVWCFWL